MVQRWMVMGMAKCGDCLYFGCCSKYVDPEETFPEIVGCHRFENKAEYVKVVRCKDCKYWEKAYIKGERWCTHYCGATMDGSIENA